MENLNSQDSSHQTIGNAGFVRRPNWVSHVTIWFLLLSSIFAIVKDGVYWPFSNYPMYSWPEKKRYETLELFGIVKDANGNLMEIELQQNYHLAPFDRFSLPPGLKSIWLKAGEQGLELGLARVFQIYNQNKRWRNDTNSPDLVGLRLYQLNWILETETKSIRKLPETRRELGHYFVVTEKGTVSDDRLAK